jgi:protein TonB
MSGSTHLVVFSALGLVPPPSRVLAMHEAQFEVIEPKPPPVVVPKIEEKKPDPPPEPPKAIARRAEAKPTAAPPPPENAPPPAEEVADFTGVTLTGDNGASWSTAVGSGAPLKGPVGKIGRAPSAPVQVAAKSVGPIGPRVVALASLSRKPQAPAGLDLLLKDNYPRRAHLQGVEGRVVVNLRILPSGRIGDIRVLEESPTGFDFATACRETLRQAPPFVPPLDHAGTAVGTDVKFTCSFEVAY